MKKVTVKYQDDEYNVVLTVRQATVADGMDRGSRMAVMYSQPFDHATATAAERMTRYMLFQTYPSCLAVTEFVSTGTKTLDANISPEEFLELPDSLVFVWDRAVFELNPHWAKSDREEETRGEAQAPSTAKS